MTTIAPVHREVLVRTDLATAFELFTAHIGAWWPLGIHSTFGAGGSVAFEGKQLVERSGTESSVWGEIVEWEPPHRLRLSWHPGSHADRTTDLTIGFTPRDGQVVVSVDHAGWERLADAAGAAASYGSGWPVVLGHFADRAQPGHGTARWYALMHTPGPAVEAGGSVFAHPLFAEHGAFLERMQESGRLVAAGPIGDDGQGMTVLRIGPGDDADVEQLATRDDRAVVGGCLRVRIQPWHVRLSSV